MTPSLACAIICIRKRYDLVKRHILPSVIRQGCFDEIVVVGEFEPGKGYRYLHVADVLKNTMDALMKRDTAAAATRSDCLLYLCDDHQLLDGWGAAWPTAAAGEWGILAPARYTERQGQVVEINNGTDSRDPHAPYCGGHAGIYRRELLRSRPWMTTPHGPFWDLDHSRLAIDAGFTVVHAPTLKVLDIDPNPTEKARHFVFGVAGETPTNVVT